MSSQPRKWKFRVRHMQEAIKKILRYTDSLTIEAFRTQEHTLNYPGHRCEGYATALCMPTT
jgi:hypothetical protein